MNDIRFSVILLTYNSSIDDIKSTLKSILNQNFIGYEIIVADDASNNFPRNEVEEIFKSYNYTNYTLCISDINKGTVKNYLGALKRAKGIVAKPIGAGDLLFDENALQHMYDFIVDNGYIMAFGRYKSFTFDSSGYVFADTMFAPRDIEAYKKGSIKEIKYNLLFSKDYICGAAIFGKTSSLIEYVSKIEPVVIYSEDFSSIYAAYEDKLIGFLDKYIVYYENSAGISHNETNGNNRLLKDSDAFWNYISEITSDKKLKRIIKRDKHAYSIKNRVLKELYRIIFVHPFMVKKYRKPIIIDKEIKGFLER